MKDYKRITNTNLDEFNPRYAFCKSLDYLCKNSCDYQGCARKGGDCENYKQFIKMYNRLYELENKIEQGRLIELPCKVGDTIFFIYECCSAEGKECIACDKGCVHGISHQEDGIWVHARYESGLTYWHKEEDFGKTVFFTKEKAKAEVRLQELKGEQKCLIGFLCLKQ